MSTKSPILLILLIGDGYRLGNDLEKGVKNLTLKYEKICGFWLGPQRAVVVSDFEILQELLNKPETSDRQVWAIAGKEKFFKYIQRQYLYY